MQLRLVWTAVCKGFCCMVDAGGWPHLSAGTRSAMICPKQSNRHMLAAALALPGSRKLSHNCQDLEANICTKHGSVIFVVKAAATQGNCKCSHATQMCAQTKSFFFSSAHMQTKKGPTEGTLCGST